MLDARDVAPDRVRPLLRAEYDRLVASGAFDEEHVELLEGTLVTMTPQDAPHAYAVQRLSELLMVPLVGRAVVRVQSPLALLDDSEPEPDIAVVPAGDHATEHPSRALLVVEVAGSSLRRDRVVKGAIYARAGVPEYWLVDLTARAVEVYRNPAGATFGRVTRHGEGESLRPHEFRDLEIPVRSILPPAP